MKIWYQSGLSFERFGAYQEHLTEHVRKAADPGVEIEVHGTSRGGRGVEYRFTEYLFAREMIENGLRAEAAGCDAYTIGTTNEAGLLQCREVLKIPVIGITEASLLLASMMGRNFALITPNRKQVPTFEEIVRRCGLWDKLVGVEYMDFTIPDLGRVFEDKVLQQKQLREFQAGARKTVEAGAEVIIPMGGMASLFLARSGLKEVDGAPVLDTITIAVKMTEMLVRLVAITGTFVSRRLSFAAPPDALLDEICRDYGIERPKRT